MAEVSFPGKMWDVEYNLFGRQELELVWEVERYQLDIVGLTSAQQ